MKNKFFTNELVRYANIVLTPKFAGAGSREDYNVITETIFPGKKNGQADRGLSE